MDYYICEECGQKYYGLKISSFWSGRAVSIICQKCGGRLLKITREEFYSEEKEVVIKEEVKK